MNWEDRLKKNICTIKELKSHLNISSKEEKQLRKVIDRHPMSLTRYYASLIDWSNPADPLRKMAVPDSDELNLAGTYDTSGESENTKIPGLQHKYAQTALILVTNQCTSYCRYCFRKRLVGIPTREILSRFESAAQYIQKHKEINNVLISGGDPLILPTRVLERFLKRLTAIRHIDFLRIGTKIPVVFPERILHDRNLVALLRKYSVKARRVYIVTQFNHPREITPQVEDAIDTLNTAGVIVNNQTVLLRGVNNTPQVLAELLQKLVRIGINPYYVFQCRPVKRVKYSFQDSLFRGYHIVEGAKKMLNGHSKRFKYVMSHKTGKIEIVGVTQKDFYFKYHQAKNPWNAGRFFKRKLDKNAGWLDELSQQHFLSGMLQGTVKFLFPK